MRQMLIGAGAVVSLVSASMGQIVPVAQVRSVAAYAACDGVPMSQEFHATDFSPFSHTVQVNSSAGSQSSSLMRAAQTSTIAPGAIQGSVETSYVSRMCPGSSCSSVCEVTFDVPGGGAVATLVVSYTFTGAGPAPCSLSLVGESGTIVDRTVGVGQQINTSYILSPGQYTFHANAFPYQTFGGSMQFSGSGINFNLSFQGINPPTVDGPVVRRPGSCHRYVRLSPSTWSLAREAAISMGGVLTTINDAAEEAFIRSSASLFSGRAAIGLSDPDGDGVFEWMDGSALKYTNWAAGHPVAGQLVTYLVGTASATLWETGADAPNNALVRGIVELEGCPCDWTLDNSVTSSDFFAFLTDFFAGNADLNCSGATDSADFFDFLTCFFGKGC